MEALTIENLNFKYPTREKASLRNINLSISSGEFVVLCGFSGSGKSTLLRSLKPSVTPSGEKTGRVLFFGKDTELLSQKEDAENLGFVSQSPENQLVTDKVWHELAFSMENLGIDSDIIRRRVAETAAFFGIEPLLNKDVSSLSGGQRQLVALACVMTLQPSVLILDEPASQLDPVSASDFICAVQKINREIGTTVILSAHRLDDVIGCADRLAVINDGEIICCASPKETAAYLKNTDFSLFSLLGASMRVWGSVETELECPVTVNEGRKFLSAYTKANSPKPVKPEEEKSFGEAVLCADGIYFRYERDGDDILKNFSLTAHKNEFMCITGSNGSGKTTSLRVLSGIKKAYRGQVERKGRTAYLPQEVMTLFTENTVLGELSRVVKNQKLSEEEGKELIERIVSLCRIEKILGCHPCDISGGEQQKAALAKVLLTKPDILLLDEPTKGLDVPYRNMLGDILTDLKNSGVCIIAVSHDIEFCAEYSDTCAMFSDGNIVSLSERKGFFLENGFYTTAAQRMSRNIVEKAVTTAEITERIGGRLPENVKAQEMTQFNIRLAEEKKKHKLSPVRKAGAVLSALSAFLLLLFCSASENLSELVKDGITDESGKRMLIYGVFIVFLILLAAFLGNGGERVSFEKKREKLSKRTLYSSLTAVILVPLTLFAGIYLFDVKQYYITSLLVIAECMLPFFLSFESRKQSEKETVIIAVLCAAGVAGRAAFFMLPQFKPVAAVVIMSGIMLGGETGFLVGAVTMLVSNMLFSQGPWTPWQMFAMGTLGLVSGILSRKGVLKLSRISITVFGFIATYVIYGGIVNPSTAFIFGGEALNLKIILSYYISGFPLDTVHAFSTAVFLWFGAKPLADILERTKIRHGIKT